jgi:hypothetical protein
MRDRPQRPDLDTTVNTWTPAYGTNLNLVDVSAWLSSLEKSTNLRVVICAQRRASRQQKCRTQPEAYQWIGQNMESKSCIRTNLI